MSLALIAAIARSTNLAFSCAIAYSRQPHGFEGLVPLQIEVKLDGLAVAQGPDMCGSARVHLCAATPPCAVLDCESEDLVTQVHQLLDLWAVVLESVVDRGHVALDPCMASVCLTDPDPTCFRVGIQFNVLVEGLVDRSHVLSNPCGVHSADDLHVPLR